MTDLEGAPLALAVAKAMKVNVRAQLQDDAGNWTHGSRRYDQVQSDDIISWRPDKGGAAGAEVLEWAYKNMPMFGLCKHIGEHAFVASWVPHMRSERARMGETPWLALCRAVVAWSEQR